MRFTILLVILLSVSCWSLAQKNKQPKNIEAAIHILDETVNDSILNVAKRLSLIEFKDLFENKEPNFYQTVNTWIFYENKQNKFVHFYENEGINDPVHIRKIVLNAYYRHLQGKDIDHKSLIEHYREIETQWAEEDKDKLNADTLRGNYIPENLEDCFAQIDATCPREVRADIATWNEEDFVERAHWGLGLWMMNSWRLWEGSRLSDFFNNEGIYQPEFMTDIILKEYHRYLNHEALQTKELIKFYNTIGAMKAKKAIEEKERDYQRYKTNDTVYFRYHLSEPSLQNEKHIVSCFAMGKITDTDPLTYSIKVKVFDICNDPAILFFDNDLKDTKEQMDNVPNLKHLETGREYWFYYEDWGRK
jgi:hypothetical protein